MKSCPKCMHQNADQARYCLLCQSPFDANSAPVCSRGHNLDPTWRECPYCKAEASGPNRAKTVLETPGVSGALNVTLPPPPPAFAPPQPPPLPPQPPQQPVNPAIPGRRSKTVFIPPPQDSPEAASGPAPRAAERKIIGILITYSWRPEGQLFPVREGRNLIGRGPDCEIQVPEDNTLSAVNSHITYRKSFTLGDMVSMSGTDLNGVALEEQFVPLPNGAKIRTGSTHWIFQTIQTDALPSES